MEEKIVSMDDFKEDIDKSLKRIYVGDIVEGTVITKLESDVVVDIGYYSEGLISVEELSDDPNFSLERDISIGDSIKVEVLKMDDGDGNVVLSKKRADKETAWDTLAELLRTKKKVKVIINQVVKGGLIAYISGMRGFIPASQVSNEYVENLNEYVNQELEVKVIEVVQKDNKIILSAKEVALEKAEQKRKERLTSLQKGDVVKGIVKNLTNFGAFVDIGGIQGLIRNEDLAWKKVKHPSEIVNVGDEVKVYVIDIDKKNEKIGLGLKDVTEDPWQNATDKYRINHIYEGRVNRLVDFGAFVLLEEGIEGLVHISELSENRITKPGDVVAIGNQVKVKILEIDTIKRKISLSIKEAQNEMDQEALKAFNDEDEATTSLKGVFSEFLNKLK